MEEHSKHSWNNRCDMSPRMANVAPLPPITQAPLSESPDGEGALMWCPQHFPSPTLLCRPLSSLCVCHAHPFSFACSLISFSRLIILCFFFRLALHLQAPESGSLLCPPSSSASGHKKGAKEDECMRLYPYAYLCVFGHLISWHVLWLKRDRIRFPWLRIPHLKWLLMSCVRAYASWCLCVRTYVRSALFQQTRAFSYKRIRVQCLRLWISFGAFGEKWARACSVGVFLS